MAMNPRLLRPLARPPTMPEFYFNAAVDSDWNTLGNWWTDSGHTTQASALPTSSDSVVLSATCDSNSGSEPTVVNLTFNDPDVAYLNLNIAVIVTGNATFNDSSYLEYFGGVVTGDATFNDSSYGNAGVVSGNATFNGSSYNNSGVVTGDATFNGSSYNNGGVGGDATFNGSTYNNSSVNGDATFNGSSYNNGGVGGDATFNDSSYNSDYEYSIVTGNATFNGISYNDGTVTGTATFTGSACNGGGTAGTFVPNPPPTCP